VIPQRLDEWSYEVILDLLETHCDEDARFDWKEDLGRDPAPRLVRTAVGMANGAGGFLVFGVKDNRALPAAARICGIDANRNFLKECTDRLAKATPALPHEYKQPPIPIPNQDGRVIHVLQILNGARPHLLDGVFYRRTASGAEKMDIEEVRDLFFRAEELQAKLRLLLLELVNAREAALAVAVAKLGRGFFPLRPIDSALISRLHADVLPALREHPVVSEELVNIRALSQSTSFLVENAVATAQEPPPLDQTYDEAVHHRVRLLRHAQDRLLVEQLDGAITVLAKLFHLPAPTLLDQARVEGRGW
jgi:hypothetical protein